MRSIATLKQKLLVSLLTVTILISLVFTATACTSQEGSTQSVQRVSLLSIYNKLEELEKSQVMSGTSEFTYQDIIADLIAMQKDIDEIKATLKRIEESGK